jgi:hypothetical protein
MEAVYSSECSVDVYQTTLGHSPKDSNLTTHRRLSRGLRLIYTSYFFRDLSETAITHLPTGGLEGLDVLRIEDTESLKVIPSVYSFKVSNDVRLIC